MDCVVQVKQGRLRGGYNDKEEYFYFLGVPYARPPVNELRFKAPEPAENWTGTRDATREGNRSVYRSQTGRILGSEDCLYLNVYTKELPDDFIPLKPVIFWIHGGGFIRCSGDRDLFGCDYLIKEDIVLVTFNYRLGLLGFLSLEDETLNVPGNAAFKDMVLALKWVKANIERFNGDPNNITVAGQSAGAAAAHLMLVSPLARGLFHKCIAQSGTCISPWACCQRRSYKFASVLGADCKSDMEVLQFFQTQPPEKLVEALEKVIDLNDKQTFRMIGPIIETSTNPEAFLPDDPEMLLENGVFHDVPLLIGHTSVDATIYASQGFGDISLPVNFTDVQDTVPWHLKSILSEQERVRIGHQIKTFYYGDESPSMKNVENYVRLQTDMKFALMTEKAVNLQRKHSKKPIYIYKFSFDSPSNLYSKFYDCPQIRGPAHCDELTYLFSTSFPTKFEANSREAKMCQRMCRMWANFAKKADPNDPILQCVWEPVAGVSEESLKYLDINDKLSMHFESPVDAKAANFWRDIFSLKNVIYK